MNVAEIAKNTLHVYAHSSTFDTTMAKMVKFHEQSGPAQLSPPPIFVRVHEDTRTSLVQGDLRFTLWMGPIPIRWLARHEAGPSDTSFADVMVEGPMAYWRHEHIFTQETNGVRLTDRVTLAHKSGIQGLLTRLMFDGLPLRILFMFRHLKTRWALRRMAE
jgi:ligand-binding SRPBCC domain-containing protein